jgi:uncharacterized protein
MEKHFFRCVLVTFALGFLFGLGTVSASNLQPVPSYSRVIDQTHTLSAKQFAAIEQKLLHYEAAKGTQVAVVIVQTSKPETIEQFANRIGNTWKLGRAEIGDGVILLLAIEDHNARIEVARALEPALTDVQAHRILREFASPLFARKDFAGGIEVALDLIFKSLALEKLPPGSATTSNQTTTAPLTIMSIVGGVVAYGVSFLVFLVIAVALFAIPVLGSISAVAISALAGIAIINIITFYAHSMWIAAATGLITTSLMAYASFFFGSKFQSYLKAPGASRKSKLKTRSKSKQDESLWKDSTSSSSSSSSSASNSKSGGGGDFAGGGASTKW